MGDGAGVAVLVNGLPGAGKSTLATALSYQLGMPLLSKDVIKEIHADVLGATSLTGNQRDWNRSLGTAASRTLWALLAAAPAGAVVESSWRADVRDLVADGLQLSPHLTPVEIWCQVPVELARRRLETRLPRHAIHGELPSDAEWADWAQLARPLALGPVLHLDTTGPADVEQVAGWVRARAASVHAGQEADRDQ